MMKKIYSDDRDVPFKGTKINPQNTKADIDGILARWGIKKVAWNFDLEHNVCTLHFELPYEKFGETTLNPVISLEPPRIWNKRYRSRPEGVNWKISLRILHWFIKETLAMSYAMQSQKAVAFLAYVETDTGKTLKDIILPKINLLKALPENVDDNVIEKAIRIKDL